MIDPLSALTAFAPVLVEAGKAAVSRWLAPDVFKPATIEQYVAMRNTDIQMFQAINNAGGQNASYPWVEACVRLMRPLVAMVVLGTWCYCKLTNTLTDDINNFAACIGFYLFGDRTLFYAKRP